jgi:hypothetical protein
MTDLNSEIKTIREAKLISDKYGFIEAVKANGRVEMYLLKSAKLQQEKAEKGQGKLL